MVQDLLQDRIVLNAATRTLFRKIVNWALPGTIMGITIALLSLRLLFREIQNADTLLHAFILSLEWLLFFSANCYLLMFAIKLKHFVDGQSADFVKAIKYLRVGLVLLLGLLIIAVSYQVIWYSIQEYILHATG